MIQHQLKEQVDQVVLVVVQVGKQEQAEQVTHLLSVQHKELMVVMVVVRLLIKVVQLVVRLKQVQIYHGQLVIKEKLEDLQKQAVEIEGELEELNMKLGIAQSELQQEEETKKSQMDM